MRLIISDACLGSSRGCRRGVCAGSLARCVVHWYRDAFSHARVWLSWLRELRDLP